MTTLQGDTLTVLVNEETRYRMADVENPTLADFAADDEVLVVGQEDEEGTLTARLVNAVPENRPQGRPAAGEITAIDGNEISLTLLRGQDITVLTGEETIFRVGDNNEATLADFAAGDKVAVFGARNEEAGTFLASHVMKRG
jgi:endonuclease YncB( thermonuclease family)